MAQKRFEPPECWENLFCPEAAFGLQELTAWLTGFRQRARQLSQKKPPDVHVGAAQDQPEVLRKGELSRSKPTRGQIGDVKKLQYRHLYIGRGASLTWDVPGRSGRILSR